MSLREAGNLLWQCSRFVVWRLEGVPVVSLQLGAVQNKSNGSRGLIIFGGLSSHANPHSAET
jgi:hypothetical protein